MYYYTRDKQEHAELLAESWYATTNADPTSYASEDILIVESDDEAMSLLSERYNVDLPDARLTRVVYEAGRQNAIHVYKVPIFNNNVNLPLDEVVDLIKSMGKLFVLNWRRYVGSLAQYGIYQSASLEHNIQVFVYDEKRGEQEKVNQQKLEEKHKLREERYRKRTEGRIERHHIQALNSTLISLLYAAGMEIQNSDVWSDSWINSFKRCVYLCNMMETIFGPGTFRRSKQWVALMERVRSPNGFALINRYIAGLDKDIAYYQNIAKLDKAIAYYQDYHEGKSPEYAPQNNYAKENKEFLLRCMRWMRREAKKPKERGSIPKRARIKLPNRNKPIFPK